MNGHVGWHYRAWLHIIMKCKRKLKIKLDVKRVGGGIFCGVFFLYVNQILNCCIISFFQIKFNVELIIID